MNLWLIFLTGLTTGGLSCLAVQGGLLASVIASQKKSESGEKGSAAQASSFDLRDWLPAATFLVTKLAAHIVLGALLGLLGNRIGISPAMALILQGVSAIFMFGTAMNLLNVHPIFRHFAIQPPRWLFRIIRKTSKSEALFAPALLGLFTVFIPCGVTQAMEVTAINSGSSVFGALIMGTFVLGTMPLFATIGIATAKFSEIWNQRFLRTAAALILCIAALTFNGILVALDAPVTFQKLREGVLSFGQPPQWYQQGQVDGVVSETGARVLTINVNNNGYSPRKLTVKQGDNVELHLITKNTYSCSLAFTLPAFGIDEMLEPTGEKVVTFTANKKGRFTYTCSMGMYTGVLEVL